MCNEEWLRQEMEAEREEEEARLAEEMYNKEELEALAAEAKLAKEEKEAMQALADAEREEEEAREAIAEAEREEEEARVAEEDAMIEVPRARSFPDYASHFTVWSRRLTRCAGWWWTNGVGIGGRYSEDGCRAGGRGGQGGGGEGGEGVAGGGAGAGGTQGIGSTLQCKLRTVSVRRIPQGGRAYIWTSMHSVPFLSRYTLYTYGVSYREGCVTHPRTRRWT